MTTLLQKTVDDAYKIWHNDEDMSYEQFINCLEGDILLSVLAGNLNYQVENGGFLQWYDNGFSVGGPLLLELLENHKDNYIIREIIEIVDKAMLYLNKFNRESASVISNSCSDEIDDDLDDLEAELLYNLKPLNNWYADIGIIFLDQLEIMLKTKRGIK